MKTIVRCCWLAILCIVCLVERSQSWRLAKSSFAVRISSTLTSSSNHQNNFNFLTNTPKPRSTSALHMVRPNWHEAVDPEIQVVSYTLDNLDHQPIEGPTEIIEKMDKRLQQAIRTKDFSILNQPIVTKGYKSMLSKEESSQRSIIPSFFDDLLDPNKPEEYQRYSIGAMTLEEICKAYHYSMSYLGDFVCALGVRPPIATDKPLSSFLHAEDVGTLLEALTTLDPHDINQSYMDDTSSLQEIADEAELSLEEVERVCEVDCGIALPFGADTTLHSTQTEMLWKQLNLYIQRKDGIHDDVFQPSALRRKQ